jgi:hypothetical protein
MAAPAAGRPSPPFLGVVADGPLTDGSVNLDAEAALMRRVGVKTVRFTVYWDQVQPYAAPNLVPPAQRGQLTSDGGGPPNDFRGPDRLALAFARHGLHMTVVIARAPAWAREHPERLWSPPASAQAYGRFVAKVLGRYGAHGSLWRSTPGLRGLAPHDWQIWNEPAGGRGFGSASTYWDSETPFPAPYVQMLRQARSALRAVEPGDRVILAGLFGRSWDALERIYAAGGRGQFDAAAIHPYARIPPNVLRILNLDRAVMARHGDARVPLLVTETGWSSAAPHTSEGQESLLSTDEAHQASRLAGELAILYPQRRRLRLQSVFWDTWIGHEASGSTLFDYAGLRRQDARGHVSSKPALFAYQRAAARLARARRPGRGRRSRG